MSRATCRYGAQFVALCEALAARQSLEQDLLHSSSSSDHREALAASSKGTGLADSARLVVVPRDSVERHAPTERRREVALKVQEGILPMAFGRVSTPVHQGREEERGARGGLGEGLLKDGYSVDGVPCARGYVEKDVEWRDVVSADFEEMGCRDLSEYVWWCEAQAEQASQAKET